MSAKDRDGNDVGHTDPGTSSALSGSRTVHVPGSPTGVPVLDLANELGPKGATYDEEYRKLTDLLRKGGDVLAPSAPVVYVDIARKLYAQARSVVADANLTPHTKCAFLFQIFDAVVLTYKNLALVYSDDDGARSVFGYSELALKSLLARVEAIARQVAVGVHDAYSLTVLDRVVASTEQRLSAVRTEQDMLDFFRDGSGGVGGGDFHRDLQADGNGPLPHGVERYEDPFPEAATLVERLYATAADRDYVRDFHDAMFLIATSNTASASLSSALETRLSDNDRNIVLFEAEGDRLFASSMCASAIAFLRRRIGSGVSGNAGRGRGPRAEGGVDTYRINYGRVFSKYRGESERNFDNMMEWIKRRVRASDRFHVFWFPDVENLMSPRTSGDQEHVTNIKNSMLQHMDAFNKDKTLRSFLLLFNASEGHLDSAFARRLETVVKAPANPMTDVPVAREVVGSELARYHVNLTDDLVNKLAADAAKYDERTSRVGGFANVQAALRELYVNQKLTLSYDARAVTRDSVLPEAYVVVLGRYLSDGARDTLYGLDERPLESDRIASIAYGATSRLAVLFPESSSFKYNANIRGDPKDIDARAAARTVFLHDVS